MIGLVNIWAIGYNIILNIKIKMWVSKGLTSWFCPFLYLKFSLTMLTIYLFFAGCPPIRNSPKPFAPIKHRALTGSIDVGWGVNYQSTYIKHLPIETNFSVLGNICKMLESNSISITTFEKTFQEIRIFIKKTCSVMTLSSSAYFLIV